MTLAEAVAVVRDQMTKLEPIDAESLSVVLAAVDDLLSDMPHCQERVPRDCCMGDCSKEHTRECGESIPCANPRHKVTPQEERCEH